MNDRDHVVPEAMEGLADNSLEAAYERQGD